MGTDMDMGVGMDMGVDADGMATPRTARLLASRHRSGSQWRSLSPGSKRVAASARTPDVDGLPNTLSDTPDDMLDLLALGADGLGDDDADFKRLRLQQIEAEWVDLVGRPPPDDGEPVATAYAVLGPEYDSLSISGMLSHLERSSWLTPPGYEPRMEYWEVWSGAPAGQRKDAPSVTRNLLHKLRKDEMFIDLHRAKQRMTLVRPQDDVAAGLLNLGPRREPPDLSSVEVSEHDGDYEYVSGAASCCGRLEHVVEFREPFLRARGYVGVCTMWRLCSVVLKSAGGDDNETSLGW